MPTILPADQVNTNADQSTDDPKQARSDIAANVDKFNELLAALGAMAQQSIDATGGLKVIVQAASTPDTIAILLKANPGLDVGAAGLSLDSQSLTAEIAPDALDEIIIWDESAAAHRRMSRDDFLPAIGTDELVGVTSADTTPNYLNLKLRAGTGLDKTVLNPGGDEDVEFAIQAGGLTTSEFSMAAGSVSNNGAGWALRTLPGGRNGFYPDIRTDDASDSADAKIAESFGNSAYTTRISLWNPSAGIATDARQRYLTASPPYDMGDGPCLGFIFVEVSAAGEVLGHYQAPDPPWAYNGPTDIAPTHRDSGPLRRPYRLERPRARLKGADFLAGRCSLVELSEAIAEAAEAPPVRRYVTAAFKNSDMHIVPHPFGNVSGNTAVLLDPMSREVERLMQMADDPDCTKIICRRLKLDNTGLDRAGPRGVLQCRAGF